MFSSFLQQDQVSMFRILWVMIDIWFYLGWSSMAWMMRLTVLQTIWFCRCKQIKLCQAHRKLFDHFSPITVLRLNTLNVTLQTDQIFSNRRQRLIIWLWMIKSPEQWSLTMSHIWSYSETWLSTVTSLYSLSERKPSVPMAQSGLQFVGQFSVGSQSCLLLEHASLLILTIQ